MAKSTKSTKQPIKLTFSQRQGNGSYVNVTSPADATGIHVHRNDATAKQFKAKVDQVAKKLANSGFDMQTQDSKYALFVRKTSQTVDEFLDAMDSDEAPF